MDWRDRISLDPNVCHGRACIAGSRLLVSIVLDNLAAGESVESIAAAYQISMDDVRAALEYAAEIARERVVPLGTS